MMKDAFPLEHEPIEVGTLHPLVDSLPPATSRSTQTKEALKECSELLEHCALLHGVRVTG
jgi:hypothetical protein